MSWAAHSFRYNRKEPVRSDTCASPYCNFRQVMLQVFSSQRCAICAVPTMSSSEPYTSTPNRTVPCAAHPGLEERRCQEVGAPRHQLPLEIPPEHAATARVACPRHDVCAGFRLSSDHVWDVLWLHAP